MRDLVEIEIDREPKLEPLSISKFTYETYYQELARLYNQARTGERPMSEAFFKHAWKELLKGREYMELMNSKPLRQNYINDLSRYEEAVKLWEYKNRARLQKLKPSII